MNECEIFMAALEFDSAEERSAWLDKACANDQKLRDRVAKLLESHAVSGSLLEHPAIENVQTELLSGNKPRETASGTKTVPQIGDTNLDFLQPSDNPQSLGRLDQYEILDVVGRGGMGLVLKARDTELNRIVAVKVLAPELASNATGRMRFGREAQAAAAVSHDHVVPIFAVKDKDGNEQSDLPYLVMEYVDGQSLQQKIDGDGPLELKEILRIGQQVAAGLSAAHLQGLIHRDVKPSNVLLQNGVQRVKITDFGLARAVDDVGITRTGEVAGTPQYMSPEQAQGHALDPRSDLFSLGSVMYAMCTGRGPFRADTAVASLRRVCDDTPRPIREINPDVPIWLVNVIDCLLEKDPQHRYQSAEEVSELLSKCLTRLEEVGPTSMPGIVIPGKHRPAQRPRSRQQDARGKWVVAAMLLLALGMTFSVTEATGVTDFSGTVIRLVTGEGTLLIEVDDPTVQISLDGEELSITGAGLQQLKLRPGEYQVTAMKDGKPFKQELVSISRGGRQVVRVTREADASNSGVQIDPQTQDAFVVLGGLGGEVGSFATLADAVTGSSAGDTIEIRGNGPFVTGPIKLNHAVTIRAGGGYCPVISRSDELLSEFHYLLFTESQLVLEGIALQDLNAPMPGVIHPYLVRSDGAALLSIINCRFLTNNPGGICVLSNSSHVVARNAEFLKPAGPVFWRWNNPTATKYMVTNCIWNHGQLLSIRHQIAAPIEVSVAHSTATGIGPMFVTYSDSDQAPLDEIVNVIASSNVINNDIVISTAALDDDVEPYSDEEAEAVLRGRFQWADDDNLFGGGGKVIALIGDNYVKGIRRGTPSDDLDDWRHLWGSAEHDAQAGIVRFRGGDLHRRDLNGLQPDDFRLRPDSAGYQAGPAGQDLGANIDFVGPGAAYERWKQTDEYRHWREETDALMAGHAAQAREPFVILSGSGDEVGRFSTLADAVTGSSEGDTIEIRSNGPFVVEPILFKHRLAIRSAGRFRPKLIAGPKTQSPVFHSEHALVLEGFDLDCLNDKGHVISAHGPTYVANCRISQPNRVFENCIVVARGGVLKNCFISGYAPIGVVNVESTTAAINNCVICGYCNLYCNETGSSHVQLAKNTLLSTGTGIFLWASDARPDDDGSAFRVHSSQNIIDTLYSTVCLDSALPDRTSGNEVARLFKQLFQWKEEQNLFSKSKYFIQTRWLGDSGRDHSKIKTLKSIVEVPLKNGSTSGEPVNRIHFRERSVTKVATCTSCRSRILEHLAQMTSASAPTAPVTRPGPAAKTSERTSTTSDRAKPTNAGSRPTSTSLGKQRPRK